MGTFRTTRFIKRVSVAVAVFLLLSIVAILVFLNTSTFQDKLRGLIVDTMEQRFEVEVELDRATLNLFAGRMQLRGLRIYQRGRSGEPPIVEIDRVRVGFSLTGLYPLSGSFEYLGLDSLEVRLSQDENGRLNLANMFSPQRPGKIPGKASFNWLTRLKIKRLALTDGLLLMEDTPFELQTVDGGMEVQMGFAPDGEGYLGQLRLQDAKLGVKGLELTGLFMQVDYTLLPNVVEFPSISLQSDQASGTVKGAITDFGDLIYRFESDLVFTPGKIDRPSLSSEFASGDVHTVGVFEGQKGDFTYRGSLESDQLELRNSLQFKKIAGNVEVDRDLVRTRDLSAGFMGGTVKAQGQMAWDEEAVSRFVVQGTGLSLGQVTKGLGIPGFWIAGLVHTEGVASWKGTQFRTVSSRNQARFRGDLVFRDEGELWPFPFEGRADVSATASGFRFEEGRASVVGGNLDFSGSMDYDFRYQFDLNLESQSDHRVMDFAERLIRSESVFWSEGSFQDFSAVTSLQGRGKSFRLEGTGVLGQVRLQEKPLGDFEGEFVWGNDLFELSSFRLSGSDYSLLGSVKLNLSDDEELFTGMQMTASRVPLESVLELLAQEYPVVGRFSGDIEIARDESLELFGEARFSVSQMVAMGQEVPGFEGRLRVDRNKVTLSNGIGQVAGGTVAGQGWIDTAEGNFSLEATAGGIQLERVSLLPEKLQMSGVVSASMKASGSLDSPLFDISAGADQFNLSGYAFEDIQLVFRRASPMRDEAQFELAAGFQGEKLNAEGVLGLETPYPLKASMKLDRQPLEPFLALVEEAEGAAVSGLVTGEIEVEGSLDTPEELRASAVFSDLTLTLSGYEVSSEGPVRLALQNRILNLEPVRFLGADTQLDLKGSLGLSDWQLLLDTRGLVNLRVMNPFWETATTSGQLEAEVLVSGPLGKPRISGLATVSRASLRHPDLPTAFTDVKGTLRFTADQVSVDDLSAQTSFGRLGAEGGIFLEGFQPTRWLINVFGSNLRWEYPSGFLSTLDVDLDFLRNEDSQLISGAVYVRSSEFREDLTIPELILRFAGRSSARSVSSGPALDLDLQVEGYRTFRLENNLADLVASGSFKVQGTTQNPIVLGSLTIDSGELYLENNEYEITRGSINFNDPRRTRPVFNFEAQTSVRDYTIDVVLTGPLDNLSVSFRSDPPLPSTSVVTLLALGATQDELTGREGGTPRGGSTALYGAGAILAKGLSSQLGAQSSRLFGLERISVDPFLYGNERNPAARVSLGKELTDNVIVTYSTVLGSENQGQVVVVQLRLTDWLTLVGSGDQDGAVAIDFKLRKRF